MRLSAVVTCAAFVSMLTLAGAASAAPGDAQARISGPVTHENLAIYFIHGPSKAGPAPLTLDEAMRAGSVVVRETSNVNSLEIENLGDKPVFVQSGDIVKGGKQDRTLTVSMMLPPKSGAIPIASFCVEHGRWSPRAHENAMEFAAAPALVPSHDMKIAMQEPPKPPPAGSPYYSDTAVRQQQVWAGVATTQDRLSKSTGTNVRAPTSASSLQLALENEKLAARRDAYVGALKAAAADSNIVGFVFAINGKIDSGDVYMSHALFEKMWPKLLEASAIEAIGKLHDEKQAKAPAEQDVRDFLAKADAGKATVKLLDFGMRRVLHDADSGYLIEAAVDQGWVHRSYLAK